MQWAFIISGFTLGLLSSFHCVGMCGPIAFALPLPQQNFYKKTAGILLYNTGRIITYSSMGIIFGYIGRVISIAGFQQYFSISMGLVILLYVSIPYFSKHIFRIAWLNGFTFWIQTYLGKLLQTRKLNNLLFIGILNGLLPCGMVYFAIAGSLAAGSVINGWGFMIAFGLGTLPFMALLSFFGFIINIHTRNYLKKIIPYALGIMAILLIIRGMNLGIPYLSPYFNSTSGNAISCH
ncbi:sulfite exporter TauE/SafE family protein [Hydrotalea sp.]|uniref:sulfite exporter TauE/SafE family protein n=1 Tax=Hydrotalea sp. TaxID=2881279 RepID=UPI0026099247|nr:sulfite exporter TauE/SafE family protein [Hydrotalea sp.]